MSKKITYEFVKKQFEKEGYKLLSKEYINAQKKLNYICDRGHNHSITWSNWQLGHRCFYCDRNERKLAIKFIRSEFAKEGYKLLTTEYKNNRRKLSYICLNGHKHSITWNDWQQGVRCPFCDGNAKLSIEFVKFEFGKEGWVLESTEYVNSKQKLDCICPNGHKHSVTWNMWQKGRRCPKCVGIISKGEIEVRNFIESLEIKVSSNDRSHISNPETNYALELDIWIPSLNKAVEYNGEYWHQDETRDLLKQQLCKEKDINLLTIWDKEWRINSEKCKSKIMGFVFN